jgi:hypothetical protein
MTIFWKVQQEVTLLNILNFQSSLSVTIYSHIRQWITTLWSFSRQNMFQSCLWVKDVEASTTNLLELVSGHILYEWFSEGNPHPPYISGIFIEECLPSTHLDSQTTFKKVIYLYIHIHIYIHIYTHTHTYMRIFSRTTLNQHHYLHSSC